MKYYDGMGRDITPIVAGINAALTEAVNENLSLKATSVELSEKVETHAKTVTALRREVKNLKQKISEQEETICQLRKRTPRTGEATPSEPAASENSPKTAKTTS